MKKKFMAFCLFISCISIAKDIEGEAKIGFQASIGVEGLSGLNIDKLGTIQMFKTKVDPPKTHYLQDFIENIQKVDALNKGKSNVPTSSPKPQPELQPSPTSNIQVVKVTPKEIAKKLILRGVQLDSTLFDGHVKMNKIGTTIGAKVYGKTSRIDEDIEIHKVGRAKVFANIDTEKFKMNNTIYFKGYDEKIVGLDKYRVEDNVDLKSSIQFDTDGVISPFNTKIKPELAYKASFGDRKEFLIAPGFSTNIVDTNKHQLNLTANYYLSTYKKDKLDIDEIKHDLQDLAPGNMDVEYFKKWELGDTRDIQKGILDGKNGSIRAIGHPTGALYGENVVSYAIRKMRDHILGGMPEANRKAIEDVLKKVEDGQKINIEDIKKFANAKEGFEKFGEKFKTIDSTFEFLNPFIQEALKELGVEGNREISSYHLSQYIPNNYIDIIKALASTQTTETTIPKIQNRSVNISQKVNKYGEVEYLFPYEELKDITKILAMPNLAENVQYIEGLGNKIMPSVSVLEDKFGEGKILGTATSIATEGAYIEKQQKCLFGICANIPIPKFDINRSKTYKEIKSSINTVRNTISSEKDKINKLLDTNIDYLKKLNDKNDPTIKASIEKLEDRKKEIQKALELLDSVNKKVDNLSALNALSLGLELLANVKTIKTTVNNIKNYKESYLKPAEDIISIKGGEIVGNINKILNHPEKVPSFDMLLGLNVVKSEHDAIKYDYEKAMLEKLKEEAYKPNDKGVSHGLNVNLLYTNKIVPLYVNTNFDFAKYSKLNSKMTRVGVSNEISYTPKEYSLFAKTGVLYKDIMLNDLSYSKVNIDTDIALKLNFAKSKWLFRPGIRYVGNFEYVNTKNSVISSTIFERDEKGNLIDKNTGKSVDISKESRYKYNKDLKNSFKTKEVTSSSKWLKPVNTIIPTFDVVYSPKENISLEYNLLVPVKFVGENFDGIMIKNGLGLTIKF